MADSQLTAFIASAAFPSTDATVVRVRGHERLSQPYEYAVELEVAALDLEAAIHQGAYVVLSDEDDIERHIHGVIEHVDVFGAPVAGPIRCRVQLRPVPYLLRYRRGCRIFQSMTVPDIVKAVFKDAGLGDDLFRWDVRGTYETREYCVQYDEDEWSFVCRLLEDEGIWFAFEHTIDAVLMVFGDASDLVPPLEQATMRHAFRRSQTDLERHLFDWRQRRRLVEGKVALNDYDGLHPSLDLTAQAELGDEPFAREHYEYPGGYVAGAEGARRAQLRLQELSRRRRGATARTTDLRAQPGRRFELLDHPSAAGEHVITEVQLDVSVLDRAGGSGGGGDADEGRRIELSCVPREQLFRPPRRTPRPRIHGVQTALVTGPGGEELHCDEHGRVKVQFHWDLEGQLDEKTSCWIRSTHPHTTGSVTVPRVGWEILVQFYEGDPDRPVVLGHLFNPNHPPPVALPAQKTVTSHKSLSSPGGGAVNEVVFDDAGGAQQIAINAGKDLTLNAVENKTVQITSNLQRNVTVNRTFSVGAKETISLESSHNASVGVDQRIDVAANRTLKVSGDAVEEVTGSTELTVSGLENMMVGNPVDAVLEIIASEAIAAAQGAAASAADRVQGALLGPIAPALDAVNGALGEASAYLGPAGAILGAENPAVALYGDTLGSITEATTPPDMAGAAGGMAAAAATDAFAAAGIDVTTGTGNWNTTVGGDMTEDIGALGAICSAYGITYSVGGSSTETIGAARLAVVKGGHSESCKSKTETVGVYFVNASGGFSADANGAITINTAACKWDLAKSYAATAKLALAVTAASVDLDAAETVTLKCGTAEVVIDKSGISCKGATGVTIEATSALTVKPPAIAPG